MKNIFKYYVICWAVALAVFNVVVFVVSGNTVGLSNVTSSFWIAYAFITLAFCGNLGCSFLFFREENRNKAFLKIPVLYFAFCALVLSLIVGAVAMSVPAIPYWVGIIIDMLVLAFYAMAITKAAAAADIINTVETKVNEKTSYIKTLSVEANSLISRANSDETKALAKKVYEAIRYSDPMSVPELIEYEERIEREFSAFANSIKDNDIELATASADELINLLNDRNKKIELMKKESIK